MANRSYALDPAVDINSRAASPEPSWYRTPIARPDLKALVERDDRTAAKDYALWAVLLLASGTLAVMSWGSWWAVPAFLVYGVIYSSCDSRWHELSHGTPFKTRWLNETLYHLTSFMSVREGHRWRWSHARHHTHTIHVGRDPEIHGPRPTNIWALLSGLLYIRGGLRELKSIAIHATGRILPDAALYVPKSEWPKMVWTCRIYLVLFAGLAAWCVMIGSLLPAMLIGLPRFYGGFLHYIQAMTQHLGLAEDVADYRLNTRTVLMNRVNRFLYSNMNYHIEHHMYPMVPFYRLPDLHARIAADCPPPYPSITAAYAEIIPTVWRQRVDAEHYARRPPVTA